MNKYQEALDFIIDHTHPKCETMKDLEALDFSYNILQELIDKATPKETVFDLENYMFYGLCPNCKSKKVADYEYDNVYNHCSDCGQKLSWDNHEGVNNKAIDWSEDE